MYPPEIPRSIVKGKDLLKKGEDDEAIMYMQEIFPRLKQKYGDELKEMWFIQKPGDLVFIPGGWWHAVVNLDDTIAITQNYCNSVNFERVWCHVRAERKKMAVKFLKKLKKFNNNLYDKAIKLNEKDKFIMIDEMKKIYKEKFGDNKNIIHKGNSSDSSSSSSSEEKSEND